MAVKAVLEIEGNELNILEYKYQLDQESYKNGYPFGNVSGGLITLVLESKKETDNFDWAKSLGAQKEGVIKFYNQDGMSVFKKLSFREAYCLHFKEEFNSNGKLAMRHTIEISPGDANYDDIHFTKNWSEPVFDVKNAITFVEEEEEEFDEQIKAIDSNQKPIADLIYCVEFDGIMIDKGRTDNKGLVKRLEKSKYKENYTYYWGDEALYKIEIIKI